MKPNINAEQIREVASAIREMLGEDFDDQTFLDTLDGETDAMDMLGHLIKARVEALEIEKAMKEVASIYTARARRHFDQAQHCSTGIGKILDAMGERKVMHPLATVSRTKPRLSLSIDDETSVPTQLCRLTPDKTAIEAALEAGEFVPGASLKTGLPGLTVRVK